MCCGFSPPRTRPESLFPARALSRRSNPIPIPILILSGEIKNKSKNMNKRQTSEDPSDPIALALGEDIGSGDVTCEFFVPEELTGRARIVAKEPAVVASAETAANVFARVDPGLAVSVVR